MYDIVLPKVECVESSEDHGVFQFEPLERGFGITLGNALRRTLLSALPGAAVDSVRIQDVYHEFSHLDGVKEDVIGIILNLKQLRLRIHSDQSDRLTVSVRGPGRVTAADIHCPPEVEIVNTDLHLLTLDSPDTEFRMEMTISRGKGYVPAEVREGMPIGVIPVDAIYSPVRRANFRVEEVRIGTSQFERLNLEVWTDGTITPTEAVVGSASILTEHLRLLLRLGGRELAELSEPATGAVTLPPKLYETLIEELDLSVRAYNCLKRAGITSIGQVLEMTEEDMLAVRNFGRKSLEELREKLIVHNYISLSRLSAEPSEVVEEEAVLEEEEEAAAAPQVRVELPEEAEEEEVAAPAAELEVVEEETPEQAPAESAAPAEAEEEFDWQEVFRSLESQEFPGFEEKESEAEGERRRRKRPSRRR
ncbi:MAG: DNA-directed RNA polymerase subunit alpha [Chloroflexi bacterium]|nr:DNA-directed RNA polymerase subunit alpha [Chloroflexota bacterium]